ncbi:DUF1697 domain-containing protein [Glaciibacter psychrotolerans]|uniref:Uncharacterized protein (DUF1697 family) n=1 Tax=Glaciibacter psychrotolerans TaxID=670054 RepID=A0A7Z0EIC8_9MICO|nr:DUF1697 domain-containing protein [Leifsonia psychrotolerans]NYJ21404.1 uncharacterized protein (DUF1697 family) [Leifsonia psychrotolerans]
MTRYVALLRGVNVGGITMKMADVAALFTGLGLENVKTVLASGNVLFDSASTPPHLKPRIENALRERFGYEAWVHVLDIDTIHRIIKDFPFEAEREGWHPYVIFTLDHALATELLGWQGTLDANLESIRPGEGVIYWTVERGNTLGSVFAKETARAKHKATTTTRNLRTLRKLVR